jgi:hypothetical protein
MTDYDKHSILLWYGTYYDYKNIYDTGPGGPITHLTALIYEFL